MDRAAFYNEVRYTVFDGHLSSGQVSGTEKILDEGQARNTPLAHLAYVLATAYHESAHTMQPVRETLASTDDQAIHRLESAWKKGQLKWVSTPYWRKDAQGLSWFGRGLVQITHKANYEKFGLGHAPSRALEMPDALAIIFQGMSKGMFTGKKMSDYLDRMPPDYVGARRIVNGTDRASDIAKLAREFETGLRVASYNPTAAMPTPKPAQPTPEVTPMPEYVPVGSETAPAQDGTAPDVVLVDGPKNDETTVVIVPTPQNKPATNPVPTSASGYAAFGAMFIALATGALKYFGVI